MKTTGAVEVRGVGRRYGGVVAVEELSFAVDAGEILGCWA
jgi:ABC-type branched-subunit amino acid transport system ATPase component